MKTYMKPEVEVVEFVTEKITNDVTSSTVDQGGDED